MVGIRNFPMLFKVCFEQALGASGQIKGTRGGGGRDRLYRLSDNENVNEAASGNQFHSIDSSLCGVTPVHVTCDM